MGEVEQISWPDVIESAKEKFIEVKPRNMEFIAERAFAIQHLQANNTLMNVAKKNSGSLQQAILNVAAVGLSLNPARKQAYLVPRKGKVCFDPSYMGLCDMATMSGTIEWAQAKTIYENDEYQNNGPGEKPTHKYSFGKARGELIGVYSCAKTTQGDYLVDEMTKEDIEGIKNRSEAAKQGYGPWFTDYEEMAKKTIIRRAFKMWPKTESLDRMALAVQISNDNEEFEPIKTSPNISQVTDEQKAYFDQLIEKSDALGMYALSKTVSELEFQSLYHSFEQGSKGKYQRITESLLSSGAKQFIDVLDSIVQGISESNETAIQELVSDISNDCFELIKTELDAPSAAILNDIKNGN